MTNVGGREDWQIAAVRSCSNGGEGTKSESKMRYWKRIPKEASGRNLTAKGAIGFEKVPPPPQLRAHPAEILYL